MSISDSESYFKQRIKEIDVNSLPYSEEELRDIYRQEYEQKKKAPQLTLKLDAQSVDYDTADYFLPEKWEIPREGKR